jgi:hypothetical protein
MKTRGIGFALATMVFASSFVGCPLLKKKKPPTDEEESVPTTATTVSATGVGAKNESTVLRYANETPLANVPAIVADPGYAARNFPGNGPQVAFLAAGTPVAKISQYFSTGVLVMFDDPRGDGTKLIGWVSPKAFNEAAPAPTKTVYVPPRVDAGTAPTPTPTPAVKDAGTTTVDAGSTTKDAGASTTDAGGGGSSIPQPRKGTVSVAPVGGKCPDNWVITEGMCRVRCNATSDCEAASLRNTKCNEKSGADGKKVKVCTSD